MKRLLSFIIGVILLMVLVYHDSSMAFSESMSMTNTDNMMSDMEDCHEEGVDDCSMVCCISDDDRGTSYVNVSDKNNKKKFDKLKFRQLELLYEFGYIYEWNFVGNLSPPEWGELLIKDSYGLLVGIIKSNI